LSEANTFGAVGGAPPNAIDKVAWNSAGLVAAIVQHVETGAVLMLGWMNREALERTVETGDVWFYSRSRQTMWRKGETSGNTLSARDLRLDCDGDAILIRATPAGPTCHTNATSCFFSPAVGDPDDGPSGGAFGDLWRTLIARRDAGGDRSYTATLIGKGVDRIAAKVTEEAGELADALRDESDARVISEAADLIYHLLVGVLARGLDPDAIYDELRRRAGTSGLDEKAARSPGSK
jgi:phosphoribosyl-ATP pyrophosphohydrolase/phosphoribosyl-AMP cyclohydrolase